MTKNSLGSCKSLEIFYKPRRKEAAEGVRVFTNIKIKWNKKMQECMRTTYAVCGIEKKLLKKCMFAAPKCTQKQDCTGRSHICCFAPHSVGYKHHTKLQQQ